MPVPLPWVFINRFRITDGRSNPFDEALSRMRLGFPVANISTRPEYGEARYRCTLHEECSKQYKMIHQGADVLVYEYGESSWAFEGAASE